MEMMKRDDEAAGGREWGAGRIPGNGGGGGGPSSGPASPPPSDRPKREIAVRVFSKEYNASRRIIEGVGEKSPSFAVTPLGARVNRLFITGILTQAENTGSDDEPMWRAKVTDPVGTFNVQAGQYQPAASAALAALEPPVYVSIIGKMRAYQPEPGSVFVSVRPERIVGLDKDRGSYDRWVVETAKFTKERIEAMHEAKEMYQPSVAALVKVGFSPRVAEGTVAAAEHYQEFEAERWRDVVRDALEVVAHGMAPADRDEKRRPQSGEARPPTPPPSSSSTLSARVFAIVRDLDDNPDGAALDDVIAIAAERGISEDDAVDALRDLDESGKVYTPREGRYKPT
jgi:hypothetical protein